MTEQYNGRLMEVVKSSVTPGELARRLKDLDFEVMCEIVVKSMRPPLAPDGAQRPENPPEPNPPPATAPKPPPNKITPVTAVTAVAALAAVLVAPAFAVGFLGMLAAFGLLKYVFDRG